MHESICLADLVDLERYPLADDAAFAAIAASCRTQLQESSFACLPGFLKAGAAQAMTTEVLDAVPRAYRRPRPQHDFRLRERHGPRTDAGRHDHGVVSAFVG